MFIFIFSYSIYTPHIQYWYTNTYSKHCVIFNKKIIFCIKIKPYCIEKNIPLTIQLQIYLFINNKDKQIMRSFMQNFKIASIIVVLSLSVQGCFTLIPAMMYETDGVYYSSSSSSGVTISTTPIEIAYWSTMPSTYFQGSIEINLGTPAIAYTYVPTYYTPQWNFSIGYNSYCGWGFNISWGSPYYYWTDPWYFDPWYYSYWANPWYYDPWYHNHRYDPYYYHYDPHHHHHPPHHYDPHHYDPYHPGHYDPRYDNHHHSAPHRSSSTTHNSYRPEPHYKAPEHHGKAPSHKDHDKGPDRHDKAPSHKDHDKGPDRHDKAPSYNDHDKGRVPGGHNDITRSNEGYNRRVPSSNDRPSQNGINNRPGDNKNTPQDKPSARPSSPSSSQPGVTKPSSSSNRPAVSPSKNNSSSSSNGVRPQNTPSRSSSSSTRPSSTTSRTKPSGVKSTPSSTKKITPSRSSSSSSSRSSHSTPSRSSSSSSHSGGGGGHRR